jgi:hypothetical protein
MFSCVTHDSEDDRQSEFHQSKSFRAQQFLKEQHIKAAARHAECYQPPPVPVRPLPRQREYLQPNRWKLHVSFGHHNNTLFRTLRLEDLVEKKFYQLNNITEEEYRRIIAKDCIKLDISFLLEERNILPSLHKAILTKL